MNKLRRNSYEAQLEPEEWQRFREALLAPDADAKQIRLSLKPWKTGPHAGRLPSLRTLYGAAARLREQALAPSLREVGRIKRAVSRVKERMSRDMPAQTPLHDISLLLGYEVLQKTVDNVDLARRDELLKLLLKLEGNAIIREKLEE